MTERIIRVTNLNYKNIFNNFNIDFASNQFIMISGSNNCGKTTLIRILSRQIVVNNTITLYSKKLEDYKNNEISNIIQCVIPEEISFILKKVEDELKFYLEQESLTKEEKQKEYKKIIKEFKLSKYQNSNLQDIETSTLIKLQLAIALIRRPKVLLIDNIGNYLNKKEMLEILKVLKTYQEEQEITIIMTTNNLTETIIGDYLYILCESQIILKGKPLKVLEKDNILNKVGLRLPFMIDLSVKLRDYDLIKDIELDMNRMVDTLWR